MYLDQTLIFGCIIIVTLIVIIIVAILRERQENEYQKMRHENAEARKILYRNAGYKCKDGSYYSMTDQERMNYIYNQLDSHDQKRLTEYAEKLQREAENRKYY